MYRDTLDFCDIHLEILDDIYFSKHKYSKELRMVKMVRNDRC